MNAPPECARSACVFEDGEQTPRSRDREAPIPQALSKQGSIDLVTDHEERSMMAWRVHEFGPPDVAHLMLERARPTPKGKIVLAVGAS